MATETLDNGQAIATLLNAPIEQAAPDAPRSKGNKGNGKLAGAPDYANMGAADLLAAFWSFVADVRADGVIALINSSGADVLPHLKGELSALASVAMGLRKAYGRGVKVASVLADLPGVTVTSGYNPTFGLYLQAAKLRADDKADREASNTIKSAIRAKIRKSRSGK